MCSSDTVGIDLHLSMARNVVADTAKTLVADFVSACTMRYVTTQGELFRMEGSLCWFLFQFRWRNLRARIKARCADVYTVLHRVLPCKLAVDYIVSVMMLREYGYSPALLYADSPPVFRALIIDKNITITVPLMLPLNQYGQYSARSDRLQIHPPVSCDTKTAAVRVAILDNRLGCIKNPTFPLETALLSYDRVHDMKATVHPDTNTGRFKLTIDLDSETSHPAVCILLQVRPGLSFESASLMFADRGLVVARCAASDMFIQQDENGRWYCLSLKRFTDNRRVIECCQQSNVDGADPPLFWDSVSGVTLALDTQCAELGANMRIFIRSLNYVQETFPNTGRCMKFR